jgi:diadenosine tetraphosphate (Ap4A) HIT family hydrolase
MFQLHPVLAADSYYLGDFSLSALLMSRDANYPWFILVPRQPAIEEIYQLQHEQRIALLHESCVLAEILQDTFKADKMNIAALGNMVPQLHLHHIARYRDDAAWPGPVWGAVAARQYDENTLHSRLNLVLRALAGEDFRAAEIP